MSAESLIRDVEIARETAELERLQTLQDVQTALFTQANQIVARVVTLLGGALEKSLEGPQTAVP